MISATSFDGSEGRAKVRCGGKLGFECDSGTVREGVHQRWSVTQPIVHYRCECCRTKGFLSFSKPCSVFVTHQVQYIASVQAHISQKSQDRESQIGAPFTRTPLHLSRLGQRVKATLAIMGGSFRVASSTADSDRTANWRPGNAARCAVATGQHKACLCHVLRTLGQGKDEQL